MSGASEPSTATRADVPSRDEQVDLVSKAWKETMTPGEVWSVVDSRFWSSWLAFSGFSASAKPGDALRQNLAVDETDDALRAGGPDTSGFTTAESGHTVISTDAEEGRDYALVPSEVARLLYAWYGGGRAPIDRPVVQVGLHRKSRLELHAAVVRLCVQREAVESSGDGDDESFPVEHVEVFAWKRTLGDVVARVREVLGLGAEGGEEGEGGAEVRLWVRNPDAPQPYGSEDGVLVDMPEGAPAADADADSDADSDDNSDSNSGEKVPAWILVEADDVTAPLNSLDIKAGSLVLAEVRASPEDPWPRAPPVKPWGEFSVGDKVDARDTVNKWYISTVRDVKEGKIFVHFDGWASTWDEWLPVDSPRLAPALTHAKKPRVAKSSRRWASIGNSRGTPDERGAVGLTNLGNTCFMNSTLQCMSNMPVLTEYFVSDEYQADINRDNPLGWQGKVAEQYGALLKDIWSGDFTCVTPSSFKTVIGEFQPRFSGYQQQDSSELLSFLLDGLHEDLNRVRKKPATQQVESNGRPDAVVAAEAWETHKLRNESVVVDTLMGQLKSRLECPVCDRVSITFDPFLFLSAPLPEIKTKVMAFAFVPYEISEASVPLRYAVEVPKDGDIADIKRACLEVTGRAGSLPPSALMALDMFSSKVYTVWQDDTLLSDIHTGDTFYIYEVPFLVPDEETKVNDDGDDAGAAGGEGGHSSLMDAVSSVYGGGYDMYPKRQSNKRVDEAGIPGCAAAPVEMLMQKQTPNRYYQYSTYRNEPEFNTDNMGAPLIVGLGPGATNGDVRRLVARHVDPYLTEDARPLVEEGRAEGEVYEVYIVCAAHPRDWEVKLTGKRDSDPVWFESDEDGNNDDGKDAGEVSTTASPGAASDSDNDNDDTMVVVPVPGEPAAGSDSSDNFETVDAPPQPPSAASTPGVDDDLEEDEDGFEHVPVPRRRQPFRICVRFKNEAFYDKSLASAKRIDDHESVEAESERQASKGKEALSLASCLRTFTADEVLSEEDPWYCSKCKTHRQAKKKFDIWKLPDVLVVHLKRFAFTRRARDKITRLVDFPMRGLDLSEFCVDESENDCVYDLFAVSNHMGGMGGGHYTAYCKNLVNGKWYEHDDSRVSPVREEDVVSRSAYVLFYAKRSKQTTRQSDDDSDEI